jgi:small redox-active disulfide protein 2
MKKLHILGSGCSKCNQLAQVTNQAVDDLGLECDIEKVTDFLRFADFGVMVTPALVVDGTVKVTGRVPPVEEMKKILADS